MLPKFAYIQYPTDVFPYFFLQPFSSPSLRYLFQNSFVFINLISFLFYKFSFPSSRCVRRCGLIFFDFRTLSDFVQKKMQPMLYISCILQLNMMSGSKAPDFDAYGLFRAMHSHNPGII